MSAITKERIELFIKNPLENGLTRGEQMELARIALASLEAEPVAYIIQDSDARSRGEKGILRYFANISDEDINEYEITVTPLYAAPPETVSVPDAMEMDDDFDSAFEHGKAVGWNAYRAAMLQGSQPVSQNYKLNKLSGNSPVTPDGWISCSERMPEDTKMLLAFSQGEIVAAYWNWVVNPIDYKKYRAFTYLSGNILDDVTHWMPLPEPPL
ncbi:TPA: DUF551 domain-containing protein [Escherichia coli]|nr:DUF551 domain-containing protein [Escherichia coli]